MHPDQTTRTVVIYGDAFADQASALQSQLGDGFAVVTTPSSLSIAERQAVLAKAFAIVAVRTDIEVPFPGTLNLVQVPGIGWDGIDLSLIGKATPVSNVGGHETAVAEYCIGQMLEWCHRLGDAHNSFRAGSWERSSRFGAAPHRELAGSTVGIVGYGSIGKALARRLAAFDVKVLAANRSPVDDKGPAGKIYGLGEIADMFSHCDFGIAAIALTSETTGLIGAPELEALGPSGVLVNVARGPVVSEEPLWTALTNGRLGGAILDVWYRYPETSDPDLSPAAHDFTSLPNVIATPHISGWTEGTTSRRVAFIAENIRQLAAGHKPKNIVAYGSIS